MEHLFEFYPQEFIVRKSIKANQKPTKKVHFKVNFTSQNLPCNNNKNLASKRLNRNVSLPKILVNNNETNKGQPRYVKNNNFIMPKCPFKSCNENPEYLKRTIFAS